MTVCVAQFLRHDTNMHRFRNTASLQNSANQLITSKIQKIQYERGSSDCGVYSFVTDLAFAIGNNPQVVYEQQI